MDFDYYTKKSLLVDKGILPKIKTIKKPKSTYSFYDTFVRRNLIPLIIIGIVILFLIMCFFFKDKTPKNKDDKHI